MRHTITNRITNKSSQQGLRLYITTTQKLSLGKSHNTSINGDIINFTRVFLYWYSEALLFWTGAVIYKSIKCTSLLEMLVGLLLVSQASGTDFKVTLETARADSRNITVLFKM